MPAPLTARQLEVLDFIRAYRATNGYSPTMREIRDHFGWTSYGTVARHVVLLLKKGALSQDRNQKRGLVPVEGDKVRRERDALLRLACSVYVLADQNRAAPLHEIANGG
jgi:SOS-response transcriptional repressor LexA